MSMSRLTRQRAETHLKAMESILERIDAASGLLNVKLNVLATRGFILGVLLSFAIHMIGI